MREENTITGSKRDVKLEKILWNLRLEDAFIRGESRFYR